MLPPPPAMVNVDRPMELAGRMPSKYIFVWYYKRVLYIFFYLNIVLFSALPVPLATAGNHYISIYITQRFKTTFQFNRSLLVADMKKQYGMTSNNNNNDIVYTAPQSSPQRGPPMASPRLPPPSRSTFLIFF